MEQLVLEQKVFAIPHACYQALRTLELVYQDAIAMPQMTAPPHAIPILMSVYLLVPALPLLQVLIQ